MRTFLPGGNPSLYQSPSRPRAVWPSLMLLFCAALASTTHAQTPTETTRQAPNSSEGVINNLPQAWEQAGKTDVAVKAAAPAPPAVEVDVPALLRESDFNGATIHERLLDFTYMLKRTRLKLDRGGKVKAEDVNVFEAYPVTGRHVLIRISENGSPIPDEKLMRARRHAGELLALVELETNDKRVEIAKAAAGSAIKRHLILELTVDSAGKATSVFWDASDFLRSCEFRLPRNETINNREAIVLEFTPRAGLNPPKSKAFISRLVGRVWIDRQDRVVTRIEGWLPPEEMAKSRRRARPKGAGAAEPSLVFEQMQLPTGEWFPHFVRMNSGGDKTLFNGLNWDVRFDFSDYKRFNTDVQDVQLDPPKKKKP
jgi:hypothetical protein